MTFGRSQQRTTVIKIAFQPRVTSRKDAPHESSLTCKDVS